MSKYITCRYCGCSYKTGSGVNKKGNKWTKLGFFVNVCTLGIGGVLIYLLQIGQMLPCFQKY